MYKRQILGLGEAFKSETRENKINLGIGVYKDAQGTTPIMRAVKEAEKRLFDHEKTKNYLTIDEMCIRDRLYARQLTCCA